VRDLRDHRPDPSAPAGDGGTIKGWFREWYAAFADVSENLRRAFVPLSGPEGAEADTFQGIGRGGAPAGQAREGHAAMATQNTFPQTDILRPTELHDFGGAFRSTRCSDRTLAAALALAALLAFGQLAAIGPVEVAGDPLAGAADTYRS
jgi:hypothetical protein